jgi:hypothetical protein
VTKGRKQIPKRIIARWAACIACETFIIVNN